MGIDQDLASIAPEKETLLTIGVFDGVHAGHRYLIERLTQRAKENNLLSGVITFSTHPLAVFQPHNKPYWLSRLEDRVKAIRELNVGLVTVLPFTPELAELSAQDFVTMLKKYLKMRGLVIGPDFALGRGREGDTNLLNALGQKMEFSVEIVPPFTINGEIVSSTLIRHTLTHGDMIKVKKMLGRYFTLSAKVISADKRGKRLGFPTANLDIIPGQALPKNGVYASITHVGEEHFISATNIGTRPTFGGSEIFVENHLLNYKGNLYGKHIEVDFIDKLRDEKRFASVKDLQAQIAKDIDKVAGLYFK